MGKATTLLMNVDGRTLPARRYRDLFNEMVTDYALTSEADLSLAKSLAIQSTWLEAETAKAARGEDHDPVMIVRASNSIRRLKRDLEATRKARLQRARP